MNIDFIHTIENMSDSKSVYSIVLEIDYEALVLKELKEEQEEKNINNFIDMIQNF